MQICHFHLIFNKTQANQSPILYNLGPPYIFFLTFDNIANLERNFDLKYGTEVVPETEISVVFYDLKYERKSC